MRKRSSADGGWIKAGCLTVAVVALLLLAAGATAVGIAVRQNHTARAESRRLEQPIPRVDDVRAGSVGDRERTGTDSGRPGSGDSNETGPRRPVAGEAAAPDVGPRARLVLDVLVAQAVVVPAPPGTPIRVDAEYDPADYVLEQETLGDLETGWMYRIGLRPRGSANWALLRAKVGSEIPRMRIAVPRGVLVDLEGSVSRGYLALELGGLRVRSAEFDVRDGGLAVSFVEPLPEPMERIRVQGSKGSLRVTLLGNASPRSVFFEQRIGGLELDLRGKWVRDAEVGVSMRIAGGSLWLPDDVTLIGLDETGRANAPASGEAVGRPTLKLSLPASRRNLLVLR